MTVTPATPLSGEGGVHGTLDHSAELPDGVTLKDPPHPLVSSPCSYVGTVELEAGPSGCLTFTGTILSTQQRVSHATCPEALCQSLDPV